MAAFFLYIIKSSCCLLLFYLGYKTLLSNETFFRFNRKVLLLGMALCLLLPLIELKITSVGMIQRSVLGLEEAITDTVNGRTLVVDGPTSPEKERAETLSFHWGRVLLLLYVCGGIVNLLLLIRSLIGLYLILKEGRSIRQEGYTLVLLKRNIAAFNWGKYVILSEEDYLNSRGEILTHELIHLRHHHSWDLVYTELIILFHWFNPAAWLLKRELQDIHEFQADTGVLQNGIDAIKYQLLLVKKAVDASSYTFANSFNHSKIKKRITMMLRRKSNNWARLKLALLIPVAAGTLHVFARPEVTRQFTQLTQSESTTIPLESQVFNLESYRKAIGKYLEQIPGGKGLTEEEEITLLKSHATLCPLYINSVGSIMYEGNLISWEKLSEALNKKMSVRYSEKKPLVIFMLNDRKTPPKELEKLFSIVEKAYTANGYSFDSKERPLLLYNGSPKNYASRK